MIFQVTGLPRSGTAFYATVLSLHPEAVCLHEHAADRPDWRDSLIALNEFYTYVGDVSTYGWMESCEQADGPKVYIDRDPPSVGFALSKVTGTPWLQSQIWNAQVKALQWVDRHKALRVPFKEAFKPGTVRRVWEHVFGDDLNLPQEKVELFCSMNIQREKPLTAFSVESEAEVMARLF